jgi:hypothetical protein
LPSAGLPVVFEIDPKTRVESLRLGPRLIARSAPGGRPEGHVFTLPAPPGSYRDPAPREARVVFDPTSGTARLFVANTEIPPTSVPTPAPLEQEIPEALKTDAAKQLRTAVGLLGFSAVANCGLGFLAIQFLHKPAMGVGCLGVGVLYGTLAFFTARRSRIALGIAIGLLALDGILNLFAGPGHGSVGPVVVRWLIVLVLVRAFRALSRLPRPQPLSLPALPVPPALPARFAGPITIVGAVLGIATVSWCAGRSSVLRGGSDPAPVAQPTSLPSKSGLGAGPTVFTPIMTIHHPLGYVATPTKRAGTTHTVVVKEVKDGTQTERLSFVSMSDPSTLDVWTLNQIIPKHDPEVATAVGTTFEDVERVDGTCLGEKAAIVVTRISTQPRALRRWTCTFAHQKHAFRFAYLVEDGEVGQEGVLRAIIDSTEVR